MHLTNYNQNLANAAFFFAEILFLYPFAYPVSSYSKIGRKKRPSAEKYILSHKTVKYRLFYSFACKPGSVNNRQVEELPSIFAYRHR